MKTFIALLFMASLPSPAPADDLVALLHLNFPNGRVVDQGSIFQATWSPKYNAWLCEGCLIRRDDVRPYSDSGIIAHHAYVNRAQEQYYIDHDGDMSGWADIEAARALKRIANKLDTY